MEGEGVDTNQYELVSGGEAVWRVRVWDTNKYELVSGGAVWRVRV